MPTGRSTAIRCSAIVEQFHYDAVCADAGPAFFVCATNVRTGKIRVFQGDEITTDAILASACLPTLFQAVEITDPETGAARGVLGRRLYRQSGAVSAVRAGLARRHRDRQHQPAGTRRGAAQRRRKSRTGSTRSASTRRCCANCARSSSSSELIAEGTVKRGTMKDVLVHMIADDALMNELSVATKTGADATMS